MPAPRIKRFLLVAGGVFALWLSGKYLLPLLLPFLLGWLLALAAEPMVSLCRRHFHLRQGFATAIGVTFTVVLLCGVLSLVGAVVLRELYRLIASAPDLEDTARQGIDLLETFAVSLTEKAPKALHPVLRSTVSRSLADGDLLMEQLSLKLPSAAANFISSLPNSALLLGTGLLSAYMISVRLASLRIAFRKKLPLSWQTQYLPALKRAKKALGGWLRAQGILLLLIYAIVALGFFLLRIPYGPFWALLIALLDGVPMLGTGLVLVPWAVICFLMGDLPQAIGLAGIFITATTARSIAEPKLLGKHLGLDPLVTLMALYAGYRIWGFLGLLAAPILTAAIKSAWQPKE